MSDKYIIDDIDKFTENARLLIFNGFGKDSEESEDKDLIDLLTCQSDQERKELDTVLTQQESLLIVKQSAKKQINKQTHETRYVIDEEIFADILENLNSRLVSNLLSGLVHKGLVESAYDEKLDDFIFWIKDENNTEKPETD